MSPKVDPHEARPPYVQIADDLRAAIASGDLKPGQRLPSGRALSEEYGVAPMTIQHALRRLRDEGRVESWQGRGVFVAESSDQDTDSCDALRERVDALAEGLRDLDNRVTRVENAGHEAT